MLGGLTGTLSSPFQVQATALPHRGQGSHASTLPPAERLPPSQRCRLGSATVLRGALGNLCHLSLGLLIWKRDPVERKGWHALAAPPGCQFPHVSKSHRAPPDPNQPTVISKALNANDNPQLFLKISHTALR